MKKSILYKMFGLGAIPKKQRSALQAEGIIVADEGIAGKFITRNVRGPGIRYSRRSEGFSGCLVITKKRVICYTYSKLQINMAIDDPRISDIYFDTQGDEVLSISFDSSLFREGWKGVIEFRFKTEKTSQFSEVLKSIGAQRGAPQGAESRAAKL